MISSFIQNSLAFFFLLPLFSCSPALAQIQRYDAEKTRELLLSLPEKNPPSSLQLTGQFQSAKAKAFVEYYLKEIRPVEESFHVPSLTYRAYKLLLDSGSYQNDDEKKAWLAELHKAETVFNEISVSTEWTEKIRKWASLSEGLKGELVETARRDLRERELYAFPPEQKPKLDEIGKLDSEYDVAINEAPSNQFLGKAQQERADAARLFKDGQISFTEARSIIDRNVAEHGSRFVAYDAYQAHPKHLDRIAVLRSELAKSKGFKTWAELQLSGDEGYSPVYRGVEVQRKFLQDLITRLAPAIEKITKDRIKELGLQSSDVKTEHLSLILPQGLGQLRLHYPADKLTDIWLETMLESGFPAEFLSQIVVDDQQRDKKNATGAYMMPALTPQLEVEVLDIETLDFKTPQKNEKSWKNGLVYILQSYKVGGVGDLGTMFHEGGHALEQTAKFKSKPAPEAYAYVETPSMTMEHFLEDPLFLEAKAVLVDGKKPDLAEFQRLVRNTRIAAIYGSLHLAAGSLFDIDLWDYDYSAPGAKTFMERVQELDTRNNRLISPLDSVPSKVPSYFQMLSTSHYTSGNVRNIGYVFAEMASIEMANFISDTLKKETGCSSWLKQPGLAKIFNERFFAEGWKKPFPENIESITGRKYDPVKIVDSILSGIDDGKNAANKKP